MELVKSGIYRQVALVDRQMHRCAAQKQGLSRSAELGISTNAGDDWLKSSRYRVQIGNRRS